MKHTNFENEQIVDQEIKTDLPLVGLLIIATTCFYVFAFLLFILL